MKSKQKRLEEITENRRNFKSFRRCIQSNFPATSPKFQRDVFLFEAECCQDLAKCLESKKDNWYDTVIEAYKTSALNYYQAGIYSIHISDPLTAFKCFKSSARNYRALAELYKQDPIYGLMLQEANVAEEKAKCARHEAAYRRARLLRISFGILGKK